MSTDVMNISESVPNIEKTYYPDSDHYAVSGWLRICNVLTSRLAGSLVSMDFVERTASGSKRRSGATKCSGLHSNDLGSVAVTNE